MSEMVRDTGVGTAAPVSLAAFLAVGKAAAEIPAAAARESDDGAAAAIGEAWQEGFAAAESELGTALAALQASLAEAERQRLADAAAARELAGSLAAAIEAHFARELAGLALAAAGAILKAQPGPAASTLESLIGEAVAGLAGGTIYVSPAVLESARTLAPPGWTVGSRDDLAEGTVEAEAGAALQRASLAGRIEQLLEAR